MFPPTIKARMGVIAVHPALRAAAGLARAFMLLEESCLLGAHGDDGGAAHPHRAPLRSHRRTRRPGAGAPRAQHCITPIGARPTVRPDRLASR